jgi:hypothetical protein
LLTGNNSSTCIAVPRATNTYEIPYMADFLKEYRQS